MTLKHLVLNLRHPCGTAWASESDAGQISTAFGDFRAVLSDWSTLPDLLVHPESRELLGLTFYFADATDKKLRDIRNTWDDRVFRIVEIGTEAWNARYPYGFADGCYLELVMQVGATGVQQLAQLDFSAFSWLFVEEDKAPVALTIWDAREAADEYDVKLPRAVLESSSS